MAALDIGDLCVYCGQDTSPGSGKFVNRIPADNTVEVVFDGPHRADLEVTGWMCDECQAPEWTCDGCLDRGLTGPVITSTTCGSARTALTR